MMVVIRKYPLCSGLPSYVSIHGLGPWMHVPLPRRSCLPSNVSMHIVHGGKYNSPELYSFCQPSYVTIHIVHMEGCVSLQNFKLMSALLCKYSHSPWRDVNLSQSIGYCLPPCVSIHILHGWMCASPEQYRSCLPFM